MRVQRRRANSAVTPPPVAVHKHLRLSNAADYLPKLGSLQQPSCSPRSAAAPISQVGGLHGMLILPMEAGGI